MVARSVPEAILQDSESLRKAYSNIIKEPGRVLEDKEAELRAAGDYIHSFSPAAKGFLQNESLIAVDGAVATEQLIGGDLIIAGATMHNGLHSKTINPEGVAEGKAILVHHSAKNDKQLSLAVMKGLELRILQQVQADHTIIDGQYLGNVSEVLFALLAFDKRDTSTVLQDLNSDGILNDAINTILTPQQHQMDRFIAIPKSDSSIVRSKELFGVDNPLSYQLNDRYIASRLLDGGEFMKPRPLQTNNALIDAFPTDYSGFPDDIKTLLEGKQELLRGLGGSGDRTRERRLYSLYFKPTAWSRANRAMKLEFVSFNRSEEELLEHAYRAIQIVDSDVPDSRLMEPFCQFQVDREAKKVKHSIKSAQASLANMAETDVERYSLLHKYRT